jgi:hypothetical protein
MGDQTQAYDIFQTPLSSGYPLPLNSLMRIRNRGSGNLSYPGSRTQDGKKIGSGINNPGSATREINVHIRDFSILCLRNVLTAVWLFKQAGKLYSRRIEDSISNLSLESEIIETTSGTGTHHPMLLIRDPVGSGIRSDLEIFGAGQIMLRNNFPVRSRPPYFFDVKICAVFKTLSSKYKALKS